MYTSVLFFSVVRDIFAIFSNLNDYAEAAILDVHGWGGSIYQKMGEWEIVMGMAVCCKEIDDAKVLKKL